MTQNTFQGGFSALETCFVFSALIPICSALWNRCWLWGWVWFFLLHIQVQKVQKRKKQSKTCFTFFLACTFDMPLFCDKSQDAVKNQIPEKFTSQLLGQDWTFYHKTPGRFGLIIFSGCPQVFWGIFKTQGPYNVKTVFNHSCKKCFCLREPVFWGEIFRILRRNFPNMEEDFPNIEEKFS